MTTPVQQLVFTSAPQGLRPNTRGFTTVAASSAMSPPLVSRLESMSGYELAYNLSDARSGQNPVALSHVLLETSGQRLHVLSRVAPAGADYSGRSNTLAHHLVLDDSSLPSAGPAATLRSPGLMMTQWSGQPRYLDGPISLDEFIPATAACAAWEVATGDAGWGGALAGAFVRAPHLPVYLIYAPGTDVLELINESMSLLDPSIRWQVTFSTYFTAIAQGITCNWRCALQGSAAAKAALAGSGLVIDLTRPMEPPAPSPFTDAARTGRVVEIEKPAIARAAIPPKAKAPSRTPSAPVVNPKVAQDYAIDESRLDAIASSISSVELTTDDTSFHYEPMPERKRTPVMMATAMLLLGVLFGAGAMWLFKSDTSSVHPVTEGDAVEKNTDDGKLDVAVVKPLPSKPIDPAIKNYDDKELSSKQVPDVKDEPLAMKINDKPIQSLPNTAPNLVEPPDVAITPRLPEKKTPTDNQLKAFSDQMLKLRMSISGNDIPEPMREQITYKTYEINDSGLSLHLNAVPTKILILSRNDQNKLRIEGKPNDTFIVKMPSLNINAEPQIIGNLIFKPDPEKEDGVVMIWNWEPKSDVDLLIGNHVGVVVSTGQDSVTHVLYSPARASVQTEVACEANKNTINFTVEKSYSPSSFGRNPETRFAPSDKPPAAKEEYIGQIGNRKFSISRTVNTTVWVIDWMLEKEAEEVSRYNIKVHEFKKISDKANRQQKQMKDYADEQSRIEKGLGEKPLAATERRLKEDRELVNNKINKLNEDIANTNKDADKLKKDIVSLHSSVQKHEKSFSELIQNIDEIIFVDRYLVPAETFKLKVKPCVVPLPKFN